MTARTMAYQLANEAHDLSEPRAPDPVVVDAKAQEPGDVKGAQKSKLPQLTNTFKEPE